MPKPVVHFEIAGSNAEKTTTFYSSLFDWDIRKAEGMDYGMVSPAGDRSIGGGVFAAPDGYKPYVTVYVMVDDLQEYLDKAIELGGKMIQPPTPIPGIGASAMFADPDGLIIGLYTMEK
ncbi:MAG: VOC family protein [candidate division Zixibacteria bacterium]|nr:VOC family protein [candidate division Zixibacteria bacterium]